MELTGSPKVSGGLQIPPGIWKLTVLNAPPDANQRIVVANVNKGQGEYDGREGNTFEVNSSGRWKVGIDSEQNGTWKPQTPKVTAQLETYVEFEVGGLRVVAERELVMVVTKMMEQELFLSVGKWSSLILIHLVLRGLVEVIPSVLVLRSTCITLWICTI